MATNIIIESDWELEQEEWLEALITVLRERGDEAAKSLLSRLQHELSSHGIVMTDAAMNTPYKNTISLGEQPAYPGNIEVEDRIEGILPVECGRHGTTSIRQWFRRWRAHCDVSVRFHHDGGRIQSLLSLIWTSIGRRSNTFSSAHVTRCICSRLVGRSTEPRPARKLPSRTR